MSLLPELTRDAFFRSLAIHVGAMIALCVAQAPAIAQTGYAYGDQNSWISPDKQLHFAISAVGSSAVYAGARALGLERWRAVTLSVVTVGAAGVLREIGGRRGDLLTRAHISRTDLVWDGIGIGFGISVTDLLIRSRRDPLRPSAPTAPPTNPHRNLPHPMTSSSELRQ